MLDQQGTQFASNSFEKIAGQTAEQVEVPNFLIEALDLHLLETSYSWQPTESRVQINYNPDPINELKQKFNIKYEGNPKITKLDPPQEVSRN